MYNTKLNEVFTDTIVQNILMALSKQCEESNVRCLVYCDEEDMLQLRNGNYVTFPSLFVSNDKRMEDIFWNYYEPMCMKSVIQTSDMCFTGLVPETVGDPYGTQKRSIELWV